MDLRREAPASLQLEAIMARPKDSESETQLVERCLEHDQAARNRLVQCYQADLLCGIRRHLALARRSADEAEEIAAQFWASLVKNDFRRLQGFDAQRGGLGGYLHLLGWEQVSIWLRHRQPEEVCLKPSELDAFADPAAEVWPAGSVLQEFLRNLSPQLRDFCHCQLGNHSPFRPEDYSPEYARVLQHRLWLKWQEFVREGAEIVVRDEK